MNNTLRFSGHETFHCKHFWLKKGYDFINFGNQFSSPEAVVSLGVGKNMVASIKYWLKAFGITSNEDKLTEFSNTIFDTHKGLDPFLEYEGTLWLLHYQLLKNEIASIYPIVFKDFRKSKINSQFTSRQLLKHLEKLNHNTSSKTLQNDINVFLKTYHKSKSTNIKNLEDELSSVFIELDIISSVETDNSEYVYQLNISEREEIPTQIFLYAILDIFENETSISFEDIQEKVADIFACNAEGLELKISNICENYSFATYKEDGGRKELQIKGSINKLQILKEYYNEQVYHIN